MKRLFVEHPQSVGETYYEHLAAASGFGFRMVRCGLACVLHGLFPFLFVRTGSQAVTQLHDQMIAKRQRGTIARPTAAPNARPNPGAASETVPQTAQQPQNPARFENA